MIGSDVTHFAAGLDDGRLPILGEDLAVQLASAERLRALRDAGAEVRPGHDPEVLVPGPVLRQACRAGGPTTAGPRGRRR